MGGPASGASAHAACRAAPSTQGADGIKLARLLVQQKTMSDLVENAVPRTVQLYAPVVTQENVEEFMPSAFES
jgi:ribose transport system substrate-binding protein